MISSPRVLEYELIIIDFALDLLECIGKEQLFKDGKTLEKDLALFAEETDYKMRFVLQYNIQRKKIFFNHVKLLKVLKAILESIEVS